MRREHPSPDRRPPDPTVHPRTMANSPSFNGRANVRDFEHGFERQHQVAELARLWDVSIDLLGILDASSQFESTNPAWERALGWTAGEIRRMSLFDLIHPEDVEKVQAGLRDVNDGEPVLHFESRFRRTDGVYRWLSWVAVSEAGKFYCSAARDVTQEREARTELAAALDALRQSQKMEAVGQLTGGLAHDFNNLLTGITGSLELLQTRMPRAGWTTSTGTSSAAQGAAKRAASLTHRLLAFSRRQTLDPKPTDINRAGRRHGGADPPHRRSGASRRGGRRGRAVAHAGRSQPA